MLPLSSQISRRGVLRLVAGWSVAAMLRPLGAAALTRELITRKIPSSAEALPVVGLGSWATFNVGNDPVARDTCAEVIHHFFAAGGRLIDSSPMYGSSQEVIGYALTKLNKTTEVFSADKVWIAAGAKGREQIQTSLHYWNVARFDLMQVHNILSWEAHLPTLLNMKAAGQIRYVGITTSHGRRHRAVEEIMAKQPLDFVQITYNILDRDVEQRILPLARERNIAVIANRPFRRGELIDRLSPHPLPTWAGDIACVNWAQFLLKFIVSHPVITCAIPATSRVDHVRENMEAATGSLPDEAMRKRMIAYVEAL